MNYTSLCPCSSVIERCLGTTEAVSLILTLGTNYSLVGTSFRADGASGRTAGSNPAQRANGGCISVGSVKFTFIEVLGFCNVYGCFFTAVWTCEFGSSRVVIVHQGVWSGRVRIPLHGSGPLDV